MKREKATIAHHERHTLRAAFTEPRVWLLVAIYFTVAVGDNVYSFYIPTFIKNRFAGWSEQTIGILSALPSVLALIVMNVISWHSDRTGERRWHVAGSAFMACSGWVLIAANLSPWLFMLGVVLATCGMKSMLPTFWTLPSLFLSGAAAASGIALINSVANLGGFFGPMTIGQVKGDDGSFLVGYLIMAATLLSGGLMALCVRTGLRAKAST
jgi:ACS family tartrate transporter-like MFS transporter